MKLTEKIAAIVVLTALLFKFFLIPGGGVLVTFALTFLAILYYPLGFALLSGIRLRKIFKKESYFGKTPVQILIAIGAGMAFSVLCCGILFRLQNWPGAMVQLYTGLASVGVVLLGTGVQHFVKSSPAIKGLFIRSVILFFFGLMIALPSDLMLVKVQFRNHPAYIRAFEKYQQNPQDEKLQKNLQLEYYRATAPAEDYEMYRDMIEKGTID